jgi:uncharacterized repeat protein (TIGR03837 family)
MTHRPLLWDIFCAVIDNYGDIGITWRLARQLALEQGMAVRLWVDDLEAFRHILPDLDPGVDQQQHCSVEIRRWTTLLPVTNPGDVVIEALACNLPDNFIQAMAKQSPAPVWLNLEYLSAEDWVKGVHGLPSPHPRLPLIKHFFMPGYVAETGGLIRESDLSARRDAFQQNRPQQQAFWAQFQLPLADSNCLRASLFSYTSAPHSSLLDALAQGPRDCQLIIPQGQASEPVAAWFGRPRPAVGHPLTRGSLQAYFIPMLSQEGYDHLLWACDLNFVRGEDSCVRAQLAGRPLVWQAYRQEQGAHLDKLAAFLDLYCAELTETAASALRQFWQAWNRGEELENEVGKAWQSYCAALPELTGQAIQWATLLGKQDDLASNLVKFSNKLLESRAF